MSPLILTILISSLGLGTTLTFMSNHWLLAWMGLEINTLAIIPLMIQHHHPRAVEASTKYFLTQATAASVILFAALSNAWTSAQWEITQMTHPLPTTLIVLGLSLKIGLAPLHAWMPEVFQGLDLTTCLIMATWQKLAPFCLLVQTHHSHQQLLIFMGILSTLLGGWGGLNQTQLRKILAYSSIAHLGWMVLVMQFMPALSLTALFIYIIMTLSVFLTLASTSSTTIKKLANAWTKNTALASLTPLVLLSLAGLPPLTGFIPKWLILQELTKQDLNAIAVVSALSALLSLYFYLRLSYVMTMTISPDNHLGLMPWHIPVTKNMVPLAAATTCSLVLLPLAPLITTLFSSYA
uniref:NADH-ubiquinone oxidoreductase chain 2 n=1 Tax=Symphurus sp. TaxID=3075086 RepID=A0AA51X1I6_9PLEU|nr:NADH dehydrogenase subunit 2 [Symphurus plagiusa]WMY90137.1 NADH dehydrogenase subunit 2 [Symphurus plagiusa]WMY90150.1 NADH dehydrogenase subunit 2 [Symphurus sp.]